VFGGRQFWQSANRESRPEERWRAWLETYRQFLARARLPYQLNFEVVPRTRQPLYLVFGTTSEKGVEVMKDAMWKVDGQDGMSFRDPRTRGAASQGQLDLFADDAKTDELVELTAQRLSRGAATIQDIRKWLLCETARWRGKDAIYAVAEMVKRGAVRLDPPGRPTKSTIVRLV
jgi:hypothetical protein